MRSVMVGTAAALAAAGGWAVAGEPAAGTNPIPTTTVAPPPMDSAAIAAQQIAAIDGRACVASTMVEGGPTHEFEVPNWLDAVECSTTHTIQAFATVPAAAPDVVYDTLVDSSTPEYEALRQQALPACAQAYETVLGLDAIAGLGEDNSVMIAPSIAISGPYAKNFSPAPREAWESGYRNIVCFAFWDFGSSYSALDFLRPGIPVDDRKCFEQSGARIDCTEPHDAERFAELDVASMVAAGRVGSMLPDRDASDEEVDAFFAPLDALCSAISAHLGLTSPIETNVLADAEGFQWPESETGAYRARCKMQTANADVLLPAGSVFG